MPMRTFRKNYNPGYYNMRFKPSQGIDGIYFHNVNTFHGAYGPELTKTERDPTKMPYSNDVFANDYWEWRMRAGDYLYQIFSNLNRVNDGWTRSLVGYTGFCFMMLA